MGAAANALKRELEGALEERQAVLQAVLRRGEAGVAAEAVDVTLPARALPRGHLHPMTLMRRSVERIFGAMGFAVVEGPEVEWEHYNFERLRIPQGPPRPRHVGHALDRLRNATASGPCCCARIRRPCRSATWRRTRRRSA